jgi:predicted 3-demethylubiquinone-9 3-methyltransferase (glyoxalase superfamily)
LGRIAYFESEGFEHHGKPEGSVLTVEFRLNDMHFVAVNGGPQFKFNEAASVVVHCQSQEEIDHYWSQLTDGGEESMCGWLKDKYGLSWQITPNLLPSLISHPDQAARKRVLAEMFTMKKLDIARLEKAQRG